MIEQKMDEVLVNKAVSALFKYHNKRAESVEKEQLFGTDLPVLVQINMEVAPSQHNPRPLRISIPNAIHKLGEDGNEDLEEPEVCLIVKDDDKPNLQRMVENFPEQMKCVKKILTLTSLRKKHSEYKKRTELLNKYSVFMADDRIVPMLHKALGKKFWDAKKQPIPMRMSRKESLPHSIQKALSATYMTINAGSCVSVKAGFTNMEEDLVVQNICALVQEAAQKLPRKWANIRSIGIKTAKSTMLPIYNKTPEQLVEIAKLAGVDPVYVDDSELSASSKKRSLEDAEDKPVESSKKETKSPLLKALKKQKTLEKEEEKSVKKSQDKSKSEKKKRKQSIDEDASENKDDTPKKKAKKEKKKIITLKKANLEDNKAEENLDFIAAKKFKGSKKGYIFAKGKNGLGYYLDEKPVVDKAKLQAMMRSAKQSRGRGGGKRRGGRR